MIQLKFSRSNTTTYPQSQSNSPQHQSRLEAYQSNHENDSIWVQQNRLPIGLSHSNHANILVRNVFENLFWRLYQWAFEYDSVSVDYFPFVFCLFAAQNHHHREWLHPSSLRSTMSRITTKGKTFQGWRGAYGVPGPFPPRSDVFVDGRLCNCGCSSVNVRV